MIYKMSIALTFLFLIINSIEAQKFEVRNGQLIIEGYETCIIESNNKRFNYTKGDNINGLYFGLINYDCDKYKGAIVSYFDCKDCGLYCQINDYIPGCNQYWTTFTIGFILALLLSTIIGLILHNKINFLIRKFIINVANNYVIKKDKKQIKKSIKINKMTGIKTTPVFKDVKINEKYIKKAYLKRGEVISEYITLEDIPPPVPKRDFIINIDDKNPNNSPSSSNMSAPIYDTLPAEKPPIAPKPKITNNNKTTYPKVNSLLAGALLLSTIPTSECCNANMYMKSDGSICDQNSCISTNTYRFPLKIGESICFKDFQGQQMELMIEKSISKTRYDLMYKTSEYIIKTKSTYSCKGAGTCDAYHGCTSNMNKNRFNNFDLPKPTVEGYGCAYTVQSCDNWCYNGAACVYYQWWVEKNGTVVNVYKKTSTIWETIVVVKYKNNIKKYILNLNNPSVNIEHIMDNIDKLPIYIVSNSYEKMHTDNYMVIDNDSAYYTTASEMNMPEAEKIGDIQISYNEQQMTFNSHVVKCEPYMCSIKCFAPFPSLAKLRMINKRKEQQVDYNFIRDRNTIETRINVNSVIDVMIGNVELKNLHISPAKCNIDLVMSYGCEACNIKPYAIFQASNIQQNGAVPFQSNCSFDTNFLSCNDMPYKITLQSNEKYCYINLPSFNKTIYLNMTYEYLGQLDYTRSIQSVETFADTIKGIATNKGFWDSITYSALTFTALGLTTNVIFRIIKIIQLRDIKNDIRVN